MFSVIFEVKPRAAAFDEYLQLAKGLRPLLEGIDGLVDNDLRQHHTPGKVAVLVGSTGRRLDAGPARRRRRAPPPPGPRGARLRDARPARSSPARRSSARRGSRWTSSGSASRPQSPRWDQVLTCNVYCTSVDLFGAVNGIYAEYFGPAPPPARIFVAVPAGRGPSTSRWTAYAAL
jgi:hypothetical protein